MENQNPDPNDWTLCFFCEGYGMFQKVCNDRNDNIINEAVREVGMLFSEPNIILILTLPRSGTRIQYNKARSVLWNSQIYTTHQLKNETYNGIFPIYVYSEPFSEPQPVTIIKAGEERKTIYVTKEETISSLAESNGYGPDTICIHRQTVLNGDQTAEDAELFDHYPLYFVHPGNNLFSICQIFFEMASNSTIAQLKEAISNMIPYLTPENFNFYDHMIDFGNQLEENDRNFIPNEN